MVCQERGFVVALACELFDPDGSRFVFPGAVGAADLAVGDIFGERVAELELGLALDRTSPDPLHKLFALETMQQLLRVPGTSFRERADGAHPGRLSDHCRILDQRL